eukprot:2350307-Pleurochrysis_carterae.AAC.1
MSALLKKYVWASIFARRRRGVAHKRKKNILRRGPVADLLRGRQKITPWRQEHRVAAADHCTALSRCSG